MDASNPRGRTLASALQGKRLPFMVVMPIPFPFDRDALPLLQELVTDDDPNARRNAQLALDFLVVR